MKNLKSFFIVFKLSGTLFLAEAYANREANMSPPNSSFDRCLERLTDNHSSDSRHFKISIDDLEFEDESKIEKSALQLLLKSTGCRHVEVRNFKCRHISEFEYSFACSANIKEGYFFITLDMLNTVNIIFNRFD